MVMMACFYRATAYDAMHSIASAFMSICLSVKHVDCDKTKETCTDVTIIESEIEIEFFLKIELNRNRFFGWYL